MNKQGAAKVFAESGLTINDVDVIELHDCFSCHELILYEALGLCKEGGKDISFYLLPYDTSFDTCHSCSFRVDAGKLVDSGKWVKNHHGGELFKIGNRWVVNSR
jgi:sterol carrier protein 2